MRSACDADVVAVEELDHDVQVVAVSLRGRMTPTKTEPWSLVISTSLQTPIPKRSSDLARPGRGSPGSGRVRSLDRDGSSRHLLRAGSRSARGHVLRGRPPRSCRIGRGRRRNRSALRRRASRPAGAGSRPASRPLELAAATLARPRARCPRPRRPRPASSPSCAMRGAPRRRSPRAGCGPPVKRSKTCDPLGRARAARPGCPRAAAPSPAGRSRSRPTRPSTPVFSTTASTISAPPRRIRKCDGLLGHAPGAVALDALPGRGLAGARGSPPRARR